MKGKKTIRCSTIALSLLLLMLLSFLAPLNASVPSSQQTLYSVDSNGIKQTPSDMTFTSGEKIRFSGTETMTISTGNQMTVWNGTEMNFTSTTKMQFIEIIPDGLLVPCDELQVISPVGFLPFQCSWWEVVDPTGKPLGEFHVDYTIDPDIFHIDTVYPGPIPNPTGGVIKAVKKIDIIEPCTYLEVHWPAHWWPEPCTWWEIIDPETGEFTGFEFHVGWTNESCEFHVDEVWPGPYILPFPWYMLKARQKVPGVFPCDYLVVEEPAEWWPEPCTWWEIIDPITTERTGFEFHVDWTNESCEFHVGAVWPEPYIFPYPGVPNFVAEQKIVNITECDWFVIEDPFGYTPDICSWWEILDPSGAPTGLEFHIDEVGPGVFHVDRVLPDSPIIIPWSPPTVTITVRKKVDTIQQCSWFKVDDPALTPEPCSWWKITYPESLIDVEFHVDDSAAEGYFHIDTVLPDLTIIDPPVDTLEAERKIDDLQPCDWFVVVDPPGFVPAPCSQWEIVWPDAWAGIIFHVDSNDGSSMFHIDLVDGGGPPPPPPPPPPWNVTAIPYEPSWPWYLKPPYPDYAPSGMPDFDQKQDKWGPAPGVFTWCGPVSVANSLWWFDSKFDPSAIVPAFGPWDDHDPKNVDPLVVNLAFLMDADGMRTSLTHIGTNFIDLETGISQYLQMVGINPMGDCDGDGDVDNDDLTIVNNAMGSMPGAPNWDMRADVVIDNIIDILDIDTVMANYGLVGLFYERTVEFADFPYIEDEIYRCEDVIVFLEFWQDFGGDWIPLYDNPSLEAGHYVTCAGVNSTTFELLISDPYHDPHEAGLVPGHSPVPHPYPHGPTVHNDTQYVSHDAYHASLWDMPPQPYPSPYGIPVWELDGYLQALGYGPMWHAFVRAAIVVSPLAEHDVAVIDVTTSKTGCLPMATVGKNYNVSVNVTVENQGGFAETFNVTAYSDSTPIGSSLVALNPGDNQTLAFTWDTTGFAFGNYTISATADTVPGEADTADNTMIDGTVLVTIPGDVDGDRDVDIYDIVRMAGVYGVSMPDPKYDRNSDMDNDGDIDIYDIVIAAGNYGKSW